MLFYSLSVVCILLMIHFSKKKIEYFPNDLFVFFLNNSCSHKFKASWSDNILVVTSYVPSSNDSNLVRKLQSSVKMNRLFNFFSRLAYSRLFLGSAAVKAVFAISVVIAGGRLVSSLHFCSVHGIFGFRYRLHIRPIYS